MPFFFDNNEPELMLNLLMPVIDDLQLGAWNQAGYADYHWETHDGTLKNVERKTWSELLTNPDKVEEQLLRHMNSHPNSQTVFLLEGNAVVKDGGLAVLKPTGGKKGIFVQGYTYKHRSLKGIYAWLYSVSKFVEVIQTTTSIESSYALAAMYDSDKKTEHTTFTRHIKKTDFHPNPQVLQLMGVAPGTGDVRASALINHCGTVWNVLTAGLKCSNCEHNFSNINVEELTNIKGIGQKTLENLYRGTGRTDI